MKHFQGKNSNYLSGEVRHQANILPMKGILEIAWVRNVTVGRRKLGCFYQSLVKGCPWGM